MPYNLITLLPLPVNFNKILRKSFKGTRKSLHNILMNGWIVDVAEYWNSWYQHLCVSAHYQMPLKLG